MWLWPLTAPLALAKTFSVTTATAPCAEALSRPVYSSTWMIHVLS